MRATLFAVICVGVAAMLHGAAGGCQVPWTAIGFALPPVLLAAWLALGTERSGIELTAGLGAAQIGLHYLYAQLSQTTEHAHQTTPTSVSITDMATMPGMAGMAMPPGFTQSDPRMGTLAMFTAHALAVVICGWWLRQGERDFFAMCRAVAALVAGPVHRLGEALAVLATVARSGSYDVPRPRRALPRAVLRYRRTPLLTTLTFRGPPVFAQ